MIHDHLPIILIVTGAVTVGVIVIALAPVAMLRLLFGETHPTTVGLIVARHWGLLVASVGVLLIFAAHAPAVREPAMLLAIVEKLAIAALVFGTALRRQPLAVLVAAADLAMALIYILGLAGL